MKAVRVTLLRIQGLFKPTGDCTKEEPQRPDGPKKPEYITLGKEG